MPITIDEVTAQIEPPNPRATANQQQGDPQPSAEARRQRQEEMHALIRQRSERLRAD